MKKDGFTLIEVVLVSVILAMVVIPTYRTLTFSSNSFEKNISRNVAIQTGQNIITILRNDLSAASLKFKSVATRVNIYDILKSKVSGSVKTYEFYSFSEPKKSADRFERRLNRIVYEFDVDKSTLKRTIYYANSVGRTSPERTIVLSKEINHFELLAVQGNSHGVKKSFFRPFFQVIEPAKKKGQPPAIREFMTTIIPHTFNSILEFSGYNRNYNTDPLLGQNDSSESF